ncbi:MAG: hypothetical protein VYB08_12750 [Candidatus Latescibacterota bacterium]|nr:hypothetical protein [Candidatus Latescibacterota bacterium]
MNGGTSPAGGACSTYVPGATPCLSCLLDLDRLIHHESAPAPVAKQVEASVVTSNAIAGAMMVWLLQEMLQGGRARRCALAERGLRLSPGELMDTTV